MTISWLTVGAFLLGFALALWIKSFQVEALQDARERAITERDEARKNQIRAQEAADAVVDAERTVDKAGDLPRPGGLRVLLGDAKREAPGPPPGSA